MNARFRELLEGYKVRGIPEPNDFALLYIKKFVRFVWTTRLADAYTVLQHVLLNILIQDINIFNVNHEQETCTYCSYAKSVSHRCAVLPFYRRARFR